MSITDNLKECEVRIGYMCSAGRPPRMSIPVREDDDDIFITTTCLQAVKEIERLTAERGTLQTTLDEHRDLCVKRVAEITKERNALNSENERLTAERDALQAKLMALEGQEPVVVLNARGYSPWEIVQTFGVLPTGRHKLYLAAGATPESLFNGHDAEHGRQNEPKRTSPYERID